MKKQPSKRKLKASWRNKISFRWRARKITRCWYASMWCALPISKINIGTYTSATYYGDTNENILYIEDDIIKYRSK